MMHRDISPDNILVFDNDIFKICDFGLAAFGESSVLITGKENYMAIEIRNNQEYTSKCDIFSLGALLLYLCNKNPRYNGMTLNSYIRQDRHDCNQ